MYTFLQVWTEWVTEYEWCLPAQPRPVCCLLFVGCHWLSTTGPAGTKPLEWRGPPEQTGPGPSGCQRIHRKGPVPQWKHLSRPAEGLHGYRKLPHLRVESNPVECVPWWSREGSGAPESRGYCTAALSCSSGPSAPALPGWHQQGRPQETSSLYGTPQKRLTSLPLLSQSYFIPQTQWLTVQ